MPILIITSIFDAHPHRYLKIDIVSIIFNFFQQQNIQKINLFVNSLNKFLKTHTVTSDDDNESCSQVTYEGSEGFQDAPPYIYEESSEERSTSNSSLDSQDSLNLEHLDENDSDSINGKGMNEEEQMAVIEKSIKYNKQRQEFQQKMKKSLPPDAPTYEEYQKCVKELTKHYMASRLVRIIDILYKKLVEKEKNKQMSEDSMSKYSNSTVYQSSERKNLYRFQRQIATRAFVDRGCGVSRMRKYIEEHAINLTIDIQTYTEIMNKLLTQAYYRLERFLWNKCLFKKLKKIEEGKEKAYMIECLLNCRTKLRPEEIHGLFKLLIATYQTSYVVKLPKRMAFRLYQAVHDYIIMRKYKNGELDYQLEENDINQDGSLNMRGWKTEMVEKMIELFLKEPNSLFKLKEDLILTFPGFQDAISIRNIKYHMEIIVKEGIKKIEKGTQNILCLEMGPKFKQLKQLNDKRIKQMATFTQAVNVRVTLIQLYKSTVFNLSLLTQAILAVNEFVLKRQNEEMMQMVRKRDREANGIYYQSRRRRRKRRY